MNKAKIVVGRKWNNPEIYVKVTDNEIDMAVNSADFINALVEELGSPALIMTKEGLKARLRDAFTKVLSEIKTASIKVM
jgi:hypothetical protein